MKIRDVLSSRMWIDGWGVVGGWIYSCVMLRCTVGIGVVVRLFVFDYVRSAEKSSSIVVGCVRGVEVKGVCVCVCVCVLSCLRVCVTTRLRVSAYVFFRV